MQMLSQREQLMEDIASIIESFRFETYDDLYEFKRRTCVMLSHANVISSAQNFPIK